MSRLNWRWIPEGKAACRRLITSASLLGTTVGLQVMMSLFVVWAPQTDAPPDAELLPWASSQFLPESDLRIYLASSFLSLILVVLFAWTAGVQIAGKRPESRETATSLIPLLLILLAFVSSLFYFADYIVLKLGIGRRVAAVLAESLSVRDIRGHRMIIALLLLFPGILTIFAGLLLSSLLRFGRLTRMLDRLTDRWGQPSSQDWSRVSRSWTDLLWFSVIGAGIAGVLLITYPEEAAGGSFLIEICPFHHWDFFVMGPALGMLHGLPLGVGVYSPYNIGYPMLVNWLSPVVPLTYGNLLWMRLGLRVSLFRRTGYTFPGSSRLLVPCCDRSGTHARGPGVSRRASRDGNLAFSPGIDSPICHGCLVLPGAVSTPPYGSHRLERGFGAARRPRFLVRRRHWNLPRFRADFL